MRRWAGVVLIVLVAMSLGRVISDTVTLDDDSVAPFVRHGVAGKPVKLVYGQATVRRIRSARYLQGNDPVKAVGVFLIVDLEIVGGKRNLLWSMVHLVDAKGREIFPENRGTTCQMSASVPAGLTWYHMACFDVSRDPKLLVGSRLRVGRGNPDSAFDDRRDDVAEIDLGITLPRAKKLVASRLAFKASQGGLTPYSMTPLEPAGEQS